MSDSSSSIKKYTYTEAQKRATYTYRMKNRKAYNAYQRDYHHERMRSDDEYRKRKALLSKEANQRMRERRRQQQTIDS